MKNIMSTNDALWISPYLQRPRRGLGEACRQIHADRGEPTPCRNCGLGDLCAHCFGDAEDTGRPVPRKAA